MSSKKKQSIIREAVGVFQTPDDFRLAVQGLEKAGFRREELGLLADKHTVKDSLGDMHEVGGERQPVESTDTPAIAFVDRDSLGSTPRSLGGSLFFVGTAGVMGVVLALAVLLGGSLLTAVGGALAVAAIGVVVGAIIHQNETEYLEEQVDKGYILLFVRLNEAGSEEKARRILGDYSNLDVKIVEISAEKARGQE